MELHLVFFGKIGYNAARKGGIGMTSGKITALSVQRVHREEVLCLKTEGGCIYLSRNALERAGDSWQRLCRRAEQVAAEKHIPFTDET